MELHYSKGKRPEDDICNVASSTFYQPSRCLHSMYFIYIPLDGMPILGGGRKLCVNTQT